MHNNTSSLALSQNSDKAASVDTGCGLSFPSSRGLEGPRNLTFGISSLQEAAAYLQHLVLGPRLIECTQLVNAIEGRSAEDIFGEIDAMKFRSSMTLLAKAIPAHATPETPIFTEALKKYYAGEFDPLTTAYLRQRA